MVEIRKKGLLEKILNREIILLCSTTLVAAATMVYLGFSPKDTPNTRSIVPVKQLIGEGRGIDISDKTKAVRISDVSDGYIHPRGDLKHYTGINPTSVLRPEINPETSKTEYFDRFTRKKNTLEAKAGSTYVVQIQAPPQFKEMSILYGGVRIPVSRGFKSQGFIVVKNPIKIRPGKAELAITVKYLENRGSDKYNVDIIGR